MMNVLFAIYGFAASLLLNVEVANESHSLRKVLYVVAILAAVFFMFILRTPFSVVFFLGIGIMVGLGVNKFRCAEKDGNQKDQGFNRD